MPHQRGEVRASQPPFPLVRRQHPQLALQYVRYGGTIHFQHALAELVRRLKPGIAGSAGFQVRQRLPLLPGSQSAVEERRNHF